MMRRLRIQTISLLVGATVGVLFSVGRGANAGDNKVISPTICRPLNTFHPVYGTTTDRHYNAEEYNWYRVFGNLGLSDSAGGDRVKFICPLERDFVDLVPGHVKIDYYVGATSSAITCRFAFHQWWQNGNSWSSSTASTPSNLGGTGKLTIYPPSNVGNGSGGTLDHRFGTMALTCDVSPGSYIRRIKYVEN